MNAKPATDLLKREFAWLQGILVVGIVVAAELGFSSPISADFAAIVVCVVLSQFWQSFLRRQTGIESTLLRAAIGLIGALIAGLIAIHLQRLIWPTTATPHPTWLLPTILIVFHAIFIFPAFVQVEVQKRTELLVLEEQRKHKIQRQIIEAKLAALQGQIEPHFLYNTLANVRALIRQDADASELMLNHLIAYLRAAMPDLRAPTTSLGQELERAEAYLQIMKIRLGERLQFEIVADAAARACLIPPLSVMTLVENAIEHAIEPQVQGGIIRLKAMIDDSSLQIEVQDSGQGLQAELGDGVGLLNLQERLAAMYGEAAQLQFSSEPNQGLTVTVSIPVETVTSSASKIA